MVKISVEAVRDAVLEQRGNADRLFDALEKCSQRTPGITRDTYGPGENLAHAIVAQYAAEVGLEVHSDAAANTYMTLPGSLPSSPRNIIGSHLDSVPNGGNFDGAAGVVAGLVSVTALNRLGVKLPRDVSVMAIRAEESVWFQLSYIGSRAALGMLPANALSVRRIDSGRCLRDYLAAAGGDPETLERGEAVLDSRNVHAFVELHIEQAPSLIEAGMPIGIGIGVPGNFRYPAARVRGRYDHVGTPRRFRKDAVLAAVEFAARLDQVWASYEAQDMPMALTLGRFYTDAAVHGLTTVPGELAFSIDVRAYEPEVLATLERTVLETARDIETSRGVVFELGARTDAPVALCAPSISNALMACAVELNIPALRLLSPASHDAAAFAHAGIPVGLIFVRNRNGSHNPDEQMDIDDFLAGTVVLTSWLVNGQPAG